MPGSFVRACVGRRSRGGPPCQSRHICRVVFRVPSLASRTAWTSCWTALRGCMLRAGREQRAMSTALRSRHAVGEEHQSIAWLATAALDVVRDIPDDAEGRIGLQRDAGRPAVAGAERQG